MIMETLDEYQGVISRLSQQQDTAYNEMLTKLKKLYGEEITAKLEDLTFDYCYNDKACESLLEQHLAGTD